MEGEHPLRIWRNLRGLNLEDGAKELGLENKGTLSRYENRKRTPSLEQAAKLSEKTGIPIGKFVKPTKHAAKPAEAAA